MNSRVKKRVLTHAHHTIDFRSIENIDWHLHNLWEGGYTSIVEMKPMTHWKHHGRKLKKRKPKRYIEAGRYLRKNQYVKLFGERAIA